MTKKKKYGKVQVKNFKWIYAFLLPTIIIFVMFYVQPIAVMLTTSFTKWDDLMILLLMGSVTI